MSKTSHIRVSGDQRPELDADLMAQIVIMLGRQVAQETMCDGIEPGGPPADPSPDVPGDRA